MNRLHRTGLYSVVAALCVVAGAQAAVVATSEAEAAKAIQARQAIFDQIKDLNEPLGKMLKRQMPVDPAILQENGAKIQALAGKIPAAFNVDTRNFKGTKTAALDGIWNSEADFKAKADGLAAAAGDLVAAGKSGDAATAQKALIGLGKACGNCHDSFRAKTN